MNNQENDKSKINPYATNQYDTDLKMFIDQPHEPNRQVLEFLRWEVDRGTAEHRAFGPPSGVYAVELGLIESVQPEDQSAPEQTGVNGETTAVTIFDAANSNKGQGPIAA